MFAVGGRKPPLPALVGTVGVPSNVNAALSRMGDCFT